MQSSYGIPISSKARCRSETLLGRKVAEGKSKLSVLNAVRNKLLARVIAVINKQEEYVKKVA